ncbi:Putative ribonuclease H protein At1g65750 [Linum grandiflorum]
MEYRRGNDINNSHILLSELPSHNFKKKPTVAFLNSQTAVQLFSQTGEITHSHQAEVLTFRELLSRNWVVVLRHTYREANQAADHLASRGLFLSYGFHPISVSDPRLGQFLLYDSLDSPSPDLF